MMHSFFYNLSGSHENTKTRSIALSLICQLGPVCFIFDFEADAYEFCPFIRKCIKRIILYFLYFSALVAE
jgi:hypothetical protein